MPNFYCSVSTCRSGPTKKRCLEKYPFIKDVTFHSFPSKRNNKNRIMRQKWIDMLRREPGWQPNKFSRVCSRHFVGSKGPTVDHPIPTVAMGSSDWTGSSVGSDDADEKLALREIKSDALSDIPMVVKDRQTTDANLKTVMKACADRHAVRITPIKPAYTSVKVVSVQNGMMTIDNKRWERNSAKFVAVTHKPTHHNMCINKNQHKCRTENGKVKNLAEDNWTNMVTKASVMVPGTPMMIHPSLGGRAPQPQSRYADLLAVIEDMSRDIRPTYAGSKSSTERLKRGIIHARALVRECLAEAERSSRI